MSTIIFKKNGINKYSREHKEQSNYTNRGYEGVYIYPDGMSDGALIAEYSELGNVGGHSSGTWSFMLIMAATAVLGILGVCCL